MLLCYNHSDSIGTWIMELYFLKSWICGNINSSPPDDRWKIILFGVVMWWKFKESWSIVVVIFSKIVEYSPKLSFVATILS